MKLWGIFLIVLTLAFTPFAQAAGPSVSIAKVDESIVTGTVIGLENGQLILASPTAKVPLEDIVEITIKGGAADAAAPNIKVRKLTGKMIGTDGSYKDGGNTKDKAFDGDLNTFFDAPEANRNDGWVGLDLGAPKIIAQVKYAPRPGADMLRRRMLGGKFQGSNKADFTAEVVDLFTVSSVPPAGKLTTWYVPGGQTFRYVRYLTPENGCCNIAEAEFWGSDAPAGAAVKAPSTRAAANVSDKIVNVSQVKDRGGNKTVTTQASATAPSASAATLPAPASAPATTQAHHDAVWKILLIGDDQLAFKISGWSDQKLRVTAPLGNPAGLDIPIEQIRELWCGTDDQIKQARAIKLDAGVEDAAFVTKDGVVITVRGVAVGIDDDALLFKFNDEQKKINLSKLVGVILGGQDTKRDDSFRQTLQLKTGDSLTGTWRSYDKAANVIGLETRWGAKLSIPFDLVIRIRSTNGRLVYVGDLKPAAVEQVPYFDRLMTYRVDKSLTGGPLKLIDGEYARGIAVHSRCLLTYDVGGKYEDFKAKVGFQQPEGKIGQAVFRVLGDGKTLYEDLDARGDAKAPADINVKVTGVQRLTLEVDFGKSEDTGGRVVWANARLLRAKK